MNQYDGHHVDLKMHVFIQWLAHMNILSEWIDNVLERGVTNLSLETSTDIMRREPDYIIGNLFTWNMTPEGSDFWSDLDNEWYKTCDCLEDHFKKQSGVSTS